MCGDNLVHSSIESSKAPWQMGRHRMTSDRALHVEQDGVLPFNPVTFLTTSSPGKKQIQVKSKGIFYSQGDVADSVYYLHSGTAKLTVVSQRGKEVTVTLLSPGDFVGEEAVAGTGRLRTATASAITTCILMRLGRERMLQVLHDEQTFSEFFLKFMLERGIRTQADLIDQLFNSSEKRLARLLLLMADNGKPGEPEVLIPPVTQETLAEMIGTTRARVSFFMNRFRTMGYIEYKGRIRVNRSLLNVVLQENNSKRNCTRPILENVPPLQN
jgi:CRP/FNR family transcriptional regulator, cyclic AMP receptor protein